MFELIIVRLIYLLGMENSLIVNFYWQIKEFWKKLAWPDLPGSYNLVLKVVDVSNNICNLENILEENYLFTRNFKIINLKKVVNKNYQFYTFEYFEKIKTIKKYS